MPSATIDKIIKTCGLSKEKVETYWKEAKESAKKQGFKDGDGNFYAYVMGIIKRRLSDSCLKKLGWETTFEIISNSIVPQPTKEMFDFYHKRTNEHIQRVQKNLKSILDFLPNSINKGTLLQRVKNHDKSKYSEEEYIPYTWNTWNYKCEQEKIPFKLSKEVKKEFDKSWKHHFKVNSHHPEYYKNPSLMTNEDLIEMLCDHFAMSQELDNSLRKWEDDNINKRWKFKPEQVKFIYKLVDIFEHKKTKIKASKSIEEAAILLPDVLQSMPDYKKIKVSNIDKRITFFWYKNKNKYLKKKIVPTNRKFIKNKNLLTSDKELQKHFNNKEFKETKELPVYGIIKKGLYLLDGNHRRYLLNKSGHEKMKVWVADLEKFWSDFKKNVPKLRDIKMEKEKVSSIISSNIILSSPNVSKYISLAKKEIRDLLNDGMSKGEMRVHLRNDGFNKLLIDSLLEDL